MDVGLGNNLWQTYNDQFCPNVKRIHLGRKQHISPPVRGKYCERWNVWLQTANWKITKPFVGSIVHPCYKQTIRRLLTLGYCCSVCFGVSKNATFSPPLLNMPTIFKFSRQKNTKKDTNCKYNTNKLKHVLKILVKKSK